jgi:hypothetical protein
MAGEDSAPRGGRRFPWLALLLLAATVYAFWVLPRQLPERPVKVDFVPAGKAD